MGFLSARMVAGFFVGAIVGLKVVQYFRHITDMGRVLSSLHEGGGFNLMETMARFGLDRAYLEELGISFRQEGDATIIDVSKLR